MTVSQDNVLVPSEGLGDPFRGRLPGVTGSEVVCEYFSFMGNTLYRENERRGQALSHQPKRGNHRGLLLSFLPQPCKNLLFAFSTIDLH